MIVEYKLGYWSKTTYSCYVPCIGERYTFVSTNIMALFPFFYNNFCSYTFLLFNIIEPCTSFQETNDNEAEPSIKHINNIAHVSSY